MLSAARCLLTRAAAAPARPLAPRLLAAMQQGGSYDHARAYAAAGAPSGEPGATSIVDNIKDDHAR